MRKVPSNPSILGSSPPSFFTKNTMRKSTSSQSMVSDTTSFITDVVEEIQMESMIQSPLSNTIQCIEQYGFPSTILEKDKKDMAVCLMTGDDISRDIKSTFNLELFDKYIQREEVMERYYRFVHILRRRKRRLSV